MIIFQIIFLILSVIGMFVFANCLDKDESFNNTYNAIYVGMIAVCGIIFGMMSTLILIRL